jgi:O-antigen/teichoic acid export membrane protein
LSKFFTIFQKSLLLNTIYIFGQNLFPAIAGYFFWGVAGHYLLPAEIGLASALISAVVFIAGIAGPGFNFGIVRFLPESKHPVFFLNVIYTAILILSLVFGSVYLLGLSFWSPGLIVINKNILSIVGFISLILVANLGTVVRDTFIARRQSKFSFWSSIVNNVIRLILVLLVIKFRTFGLIAAFGIGSFASLFVAWVVFLPKVEIGYHAKASFDWQILKSITPFSFGNYIATLLSQLSLTLLPLMTLEILGAEANGQAFFALMIGGTLTSPGLSLATASLAEGANEPENYQGILRKASHYAIFVTTAITFFVLVFAPLILRILNPSYTSASMDLLRLLALASIPVVINQFYFTLLRIQKKTFHLVILSIITAILIISIAYNLMPQLGIVANGLGLLIGNAIITLSFLFSGNFRKTILL